MKKIMMTKEKAEKLLRLVVEHSDDNYGRFDDAINDDDGLFPGVLPEYEHEAEPFEIEWEE